METLILFVFFYLYQAISLDYIDLIYIIPKLFINCNHMPIQGLIFQFSLDFFQLPSISSDIVYKSSSWHFFTEGQRSLSVEEHSQVVMSQNYGLDCGLSGAKCNELCCLITRLASFPDSPYSKSSSQHAFLLKTKIIKCLCLLWCCLLIIKAFLKCG